MWMKIRLFANAPANKMVLTCNGKDYTAIQLGAVMTHSDYRHQGLTVKLINHFLVKHGLYFNFIYLFANATVLDFYPKFGFEKIQESSFTLMVSDLKNKLRKKPYCVSWMSIIRLTSSL